MKIKFSEVKHKDGIEQVFVRDKRISKVQVSGWMPVNAKEYGGKDGEKVYSGDSDLVLVFRATKKSVVKEAPKVEDKPKVEKPDLPKASAVSPAKVVLPKKPSKEIETKYSSKQKLADKWKGRKFKR